MKEKTVEDRILEIKSIAMSHNADIARDIECWNYYNEHYDNSQFDYLTKSGNYSYPSRLRRVGKQKPLINLLISTQATRSYPFSVSILSKSFVEKKKKRRIMNFIDDIRQRLMDRMMQVQRNVMSMDQSIQQMEQAISQEPQDEEQAMIIGQIKAQLPMLKMQYEAIKKEMTIRSLYTGTELEDKERYYKYSDKDLIEEAVQILASNLRKRLKIKSKSVRNMKNKVVTGKEFYYINYHDGESDIEFESLRTTDVFYPQLEDVYWVHEGPWVAIRNMMSIEDIKLLYGDKIDKDKLKQLEDFAAHRDVGRSGIYPTSAGGAVFASGNVQTNGKLDVYSGSVESAQTFEVWQIWYRQGKFVYAKKRPNPVKEGRFFFHVIKDEDKDKLKKDEELVKKWIEHRYTGIVINGDITVDCGIDAIQPRMKSRPSKVILPVIGYSYNEMTNRPYSLIWSTKDLQDLYRIVHYMRELVIALSGVRSKIIDMSQTPGWMTPEEHRYHSKMGNLYIETVDEMGRKVNSSFNQWRDFDDTLSASVQYYDIILRQIDDEIGETMGISRPRRGERVVSDQVGTSMQGQQQSELITEIHFYDHDQVEAEAMRVALDLSLSYVHSPEELINADTDDILVDRDNIKLPKEMFDEEYEYEIVCQADYKEAKRIEEVRTLAYQNYAKGAMTYRQILNIVSSDSIKAMEKKLEYFEEKQRELSQMNQMQAIDAEKNAQQELTAFAKQYEMEAQKMNNESKRLSEEVKMKIAQMNDMREREKLALEMDSEQKDRDTQVMVAGMEKETEEKYLGEQSRTNMVHEQLEAIKMQLEVMAKSIASKAAGGKERIKD